MPLALLMQVGATPFPLNTSTARAQPFAESMTEQTKKRDSKATVAVRRIRSGTAAESHGQQADCARRLRSSMDRQDEGSQLPSASMKAAAIAAE
jgi:hypothetical protein